MIIRILMTCCFCIGFSLCNGVDSMAKDQPLPDKTGILLVAFGTSVPEAQAVYQNVESKTKTAFPDIPIKWGYTSHVVRKKLAKTGQYIDSVETALARMMDEGFTHVAVQSLLVIPGKEHHDVIINSRLFSQMAGGFKKIAIGHPLLGNDSAMEKVTSALLGIIPKNRKPNEAAIFIGHGTWHLANVSYTALMFHLQQKDPKVFVGTIGGWLDAGAIKERLSKQKVKTAYLLPLMTVAGDHSINDIAGEEEDSWKSILSKAGISCKPVLKGLAAYDTIAGIWVDHLKQAMKELKD